MKTFKFYADPGHGWLAVKTQQILALNLQDQISQYSYIKGKTAYLEEDSDATIFLNKFKEAFGEYKIEHKHTDKRSVIRSYERFDSKKAFSAFKSE